MKGTDKNKTNEKNDYDYKNTKKKILDILKSLEEKSNADEIKIVQDKLDYFIQASKDLGIPFIYFLIELKITKLKINLISLLTSLYFDNIEKKKIEKLFIIIFKAFNYKGPEKNNITNPIEYDFLKNIEKFDSLEDYLNEKMRDGNQIENIYSKIASTIEKYYSYIKIKEYSEEDIIEIKSQYEDCKKEIETLKKCKDIPNLNYNIDFFNDLIKNINLKKLDTKKADDDDEEDEDENNINNINEDDDDLSLSKNNSLSQHFEIIPLKDKKFFILDDILNFGEDTEIEFKNYKFFKDKNKAISDTLVDTIKRLICGLLNNKGGRIYFGINDEKTVKGNTLKYKQRDQLRLELLNLTNSFYPECKSSKLSVHFIPIKDQNNKFLYNRYITKMIVKQGDTDKLYSVSNQVYESYKRLQGMVTQLKPEVIANEIIKRKTNPEKPIPEKEFEDPKPEEVFYETKFKYMDENYNNNYTNNDYYNDNNNNYNNNDYYNDNNNIYNDNDYYNDDYYNNKNYNNYKNNSKYYGDNNYKGKRRGRKQKYQLMRIKVSNIDRDIPVVFLKDFFHECKNIIIDTEFFQEDGLSLGYGNIYVKDKKSGKIIIDRYNNKNFYNQKLKLYFDDSEEYNEN